MNLPPLDWEKRAVRSAVFRGVVGLGIGLVLAGTQWLRTGAWKGNDVFWLVVGLACVGYFDGAITSLHERLAEISELLAAKRNS